MADENIKDFAVNWVLFGFLFFSLLTFTIIFVSHNNSIALGDSEQNFQSAKSDIEGSLVEVEDNINSNINTSAVLSSEETTLGTQAAASTSYGLFSTGKNFWQNSKVFMGWVFSGLMGQILIAVFGGIIGIAGTYYVIRLIRAIF